MILKREYEGPVALIWQFQLIVPLPCLQNQGTVNTCPRPHLLRRDSLDGKGEQARVPYMASDFAWIPSSGLAPLIITALKIATSLSHIFQMRNQSPEMSMNRPSVTQQASWGMNRDSCHSERALSTASFAHPPTPTIIALPWNSLTEALPAILSPIWLVFAKLEFQQTSSLKTKVGRRNPSLTNPWQKRGLWDPWRQSDPRVVMVWN